MTKITLDSKTLENLIEELMDAEVALRCHLAAFSRALTPSDQATFANFADEARPQADAAVKLRFRALLETCESGKDISLELSRFLHLPASD
jgi:hypothetical protein